MSSFFKKFGKGVLYLLVLPFLLIILSFYAVIGLVMFIVLGIYSICLFFMGKSIHGDLPEDIEAKKILSTMTPNNQNVYPQSINNTPQMQINNVPNEPILNNQTQPSNDSSLNDQDNFSESEDINND